MPERDNEMLFYAFRYCLGRMSYAVQDFCEYAKAHLQEISEKYLLLMNKEIDEAGARVYGPPDSYANTGLGMNCDLVAWRNLQISIKDELKRREAKKQPEESTVIEPYVGKEVVLYCPKCKDYCAVIANMYRLDRLQTGVLQFPDHCEINFDCMLEVEGDFEYICEYCGTKLADSLEDIENKLKETENGNV